MLIRLLTGVATGGPTFVEGDVVDWAPDASAKEFCKKNLAEPVDRKELAPGQKVRTYQEPPQKPEDKWEVGKGQFPDRPKRRRPDEATIEAEK